MTSVKEFRVERDPTPTELGRGAFYFTDAYSVFDWGEMPDPIPDKGRSLCAMGAFNFERLEDGGVPTHYRGVVPGSATHTDRPPAQAPIPISECDTAPREMAIDLTIVPELPHDGRTYDYDAYHDAVDTHYLVPLEIVFRNTVPIGSSLRRRSDPADHGLAFDEWPDDPVELAEPIVEFSTKYEESDRYLDREDADRIAGMADIEDLEAIARAVNRIVTERSAETGFDHQDGKIECLYADGEIRVADVVGTFDENRFAYDGQQVSKEVVRQYHKRTQPDWVAAVDDAKARAKRMDVADWRPLCDLQPEPLPDRVLEAVRDLYCAGANRYVRRTLLEAPSMDAAVAAVRDR